MRDAEKIDKLINSKLKTKASPQLDRRIDNLITQADKTQTQTSNIWRIIMENRITKFATAAVIVIAVLLSITFFEKTTSTAYAIEQTIEANRGMRYLHTKYFQDGHMMWQKSLGLNLMRPGL